MCLKCLSILQLVVKGVILFISKRGASDSTMIVLCTNL